MLVNPIETADLWDLRAAPATLEQQAAAWRQLRDAASAAQETIDLAAHRVFGQDAWTGTTANSYDRHRLRVTADLDATARSAGSVAETLDYLAGILRFNQELLIGERARLAAVPLIGGGTGLIFHPRDEADAGLVRQAISNANEIRSRVDDEIAVKKTTFSSARQTLAGIDEQWRPRTFGMLNLNMGQGYKNSPHNSAGTDRSDMDTMADVIAGANVDVVTLQEVFGSDVERLERELRERTGQDWTIYFGEASEKVYWSDGYRPIGFHEPFGNAIAVRYGGEITTSEQTDTIKLDVYGSIAAGSGPPTGTTVPGPTTPPEPIITDGEGRAATEVHVAFRPTS